MTFLPSHSSPTSVVRRVDRGADDRAVVELEGEIDVATAEQLRSTFRDVLSPTPVTVLVDATDVTFMDSTGISALLGAHNRCTELGAVLSVLPSAPMQRVLDAMGLTDLLGERRELDSF